jgi:TolB protein
VEKMVNKALSFIGILLFIGMFPVSTEPQNYGKIAFMSNRDHIVHQLYIMNGDGTEPIRVTYSDWTPFFPAWAPDGTKVVFMFECDYRYQCPFKIKIFDLNENSLIDPQLPFELSVCPAWSPDGKKIAFYAFNEDKSGIYIMDVDTKDVINLTHGLGAEEGLAWAPDGKKITFTLGRYMYVINVDGTNKKRLTTDGNNSSWSLDGKKIVFDSKRDGKREIYIMDADGSNQVNLTNNPADDFDPVWSPDGKRIAFSSNRDGNYEIYVMDADGSNQINLTNNPADDRCPDWCCQTLLEDTISLFHYIIIVTIISALIIIVISYKILKKRN